MRIAILSSTDEGCALALRLSEFEQQAQLFSTRASDDPRITRIQSLGAFLAGAFPNFDAFVFIGALGICVRSIAPFLNHKNVDPAVVNLDERAQHVQSVLSGHQGGANELARRFARHLGAVPVITTASDVQDLWPLDLLGVEQHWTPEATPCITDTISLFVNRRPTALLLEIRDKGTDYLERSRPAHVEIFHRLADINPKRFALLLAVTHRRFALGIPTLFYRPRVLSLGVGCTKGTPGTDLIASVGSFLEENGFASASVKTIASASLKEGESALHELARSFGADFRCYDEKTLAEQPVKTPSQVVQRKIGIPSVSEAAALAASQGGTLLLPKCKAALAGGHHHTLAIALDRHSCRKASIAIVGAGPGDPELISVRGMQLLQQADYILYAGSLVPVELTRYAKPGATVESSAGMDLPTQIKAMAKRYNMGHTIVRLHTGDPCLYGAIQEQMAEFDARGWSYSIIPGISAFQAAAARLRSEFTVPEEVQTIILTRGEGNTPMPEREKLADLAAHRATLCIYLSIALAEQVQRDLLQHYPPETPLAVLHRVTWPDERVFTGKLNDLCEIVRTQHLTRTTLIVVGSAIGARRGLSHLYHPAIGHGFRAVGAGGRG